MGAHYFADRMTQLLQSVLVMLLFAAISRARLASAMEPYTSLLPPPHPEQPNNAPYNQLVYIVQFSGKPTIAAFSDVFNSTQKRNHTDMNWGRVADAMAYSKNLTNVQNNFLSKFLKKGSYRQVYSFTYCLNAVGVRLSSMSQVRALQRAVGVQIERDTRLESHTTHTPSFLGLSNPSRGTWKLVAGFRGAAGAGEGMVIGLVDTGITPDHPSFSDSVGQPYSPIPSTFFGTCQTDNTTFPAGSCNRKLVGARYFAKSAIAYNFLDSTDFVSPLDGNGHGTHTTAIAGGNFQVDVEVQGQEFGMASGIAPRARVAAYKCIFRFGGLLSDCIAAIQQAVLDGVTVVNLSLGPPSPPAGITFLSALDLAMLQAVKSGVVVVQSVGNYGPAGGTLSSFSPWIISVGASTTDRTFPVYLTIGSGQTLTGAGYSGGNLGTTTMVSAADVALPDAASGYNPTDCQVAEDLDGSQVDGKLLLCFYSDAFESGASIVPQVAITARQLNAAGFALIAANNSINFPISYQDLPFQIPGVFLTDQASSQIVENYYNDNNATTATASISIPSDYSADYDSVAPVVMDFSSRGPVISNSDFGSTGDVLKPDLVAPGDSIWSAWTSDGVDLRYWNSNFASRTGTSEAAPHVAGVVALIKQRHPGWSPAAIQSALVTSAKQKANNGQPIRAQYPSSDPDSTIGLASPFDMGGGFLNPSAALDPGLIFDRGYRDYINFLCTVPGANAADILRLTGSSCNTSTATYGSDLNMPSITIASLRGTRTVVRIATSVSLLPEMYTASIGVPSGVSLSVYPTSFLAAFPGSKISFTATFRVINSVQQYTFGSITWRGSLGHVVYMPVSVFPDKS